MFRSCQSISGYKYVLRCSVLPLSCRHGVTDICYWGAINLHMHAGVMLRLFTKCWQFKCLRFAMPSLMLTSVHNCWHCQTCIASLSLTLVYFSFVVVWSCIWDHPIPITPICMRPLDVHIKDSIFKIVVSHHFNAIHYKSCIYVV